MLLLGCASACDRLLAQLGRPHAFAESWVCSKLLLLLRAMLLRAVLLFVAFALLDSARSPLF